MPRLAVSMSDAQYKWIESQSESLDCSMAEVVRNLIDSRRDDESPGDSHLNHFPDDDSSNESQMNHGVNRESRSDSSGDSLPNREVARQLAEVEQRLANLEDRVSAGGREEAETDPRSPQEDERGARPTREADAERDGPRAAHEKDRDAREIEEGTADDQRSDRQKQVDRAVDRAAEHWGDSGARLEARREAARAVLSALAEHDHGLTKTEIVRDFYGEHPVDGQSETTWWRRNLAEGAEDGPAPLGLVAEYSRGTHKWTWTGFDTEEEEAQADT